MLCWQSKRVSLKTTCSFCLVVVLNRAQTGRSAPPPTIHYSCQPNTFYEYNRFALDMDDVYDYETIKHETFSELLESYKELVPSKLAELEEQRLEIIPKALSERADDAHLKKTEVQKLVDWKLYVQKC